MTNEIISMPGEIRKPVTKERFTVFKFKRKDGSILYSGYIAPGDSLNEQKTREAKNYFSDQAEQFGIQLEEIVWIDSLELLGVNVESIKSWNSIKASIIQSEISPIHTALQELAKEGVSAEILEDIKGDVDFGANRKKLEQYLEIYFPGDILVKRALDIAIEAHKETAAKGFKDLPYSNHPIQIANIAIERLKIRDSHMIQSILLHDVAEDTTVGLENLATEFGEEVMEILGDVTKGKTESREEYLKRVASPKNPKSKIIKSIDRFHNLLRSFTMNAGNYHNPKRSFAEYLTGYIKETEEIYEQAFESIPELAPIAMKFFRLFEEVKKRSLQIAK